MIDLHSHPLAGIDDGARDLDESLEILSRMEREGVTAVAATPHVRDDWPTTPDAMEQAVAELRDAAARAGLAIDVLPGAEIALDLVGQIPPSELARYGLGGNPNLLLLEFPYFGFPLDLPATVFRLKSMGTVPVLAHPERNADVQDDPDRLEPLVRTGAVIQVTADSLVGNAGKAARACAETLLDRELAHLVASDSHAVSLGRAGLAEAVGKLGDDELATWLTQAVPEALLESRPLPPRPSVTHRRRRRFGR